MPITLCWWRMCAAVSVEGEQGHDGYDDSDVRSGCVNFVVNKLDVCFYF